jgi:pimeloyl-ACP methyl ester carboxylesterase
VVGNPGESAAITSPGSLDQMLAIAGRGWRNEFAARGLLHVGAYRPGRLAGRITRPVLMQIADHDTVAPPDAAQRVADKITATVHRYSCDHFEVYTGMPFHDRIAADQAAFLRRIFTSSQHREEAP